jgi:ADP-heptose:LPS heptosyltransferase
MSATVARILLIRRDNIGDLVCTTPLLEALRAAQPGAHLAALVTTYNAEVLARNRALDAVHVYEKSKHRSGSMFGNLRARLALVSRLRAERFDCVLVPAPAPQTLRLARGLKPRRLIAAEPERRDTRHEVERTFALGAALGVGGMPGPMRVYPDPRAQASLRERLGPGPWIAVHISARRRSQHWPLGRYAALIRELARRARVMLLWAPGAKNDPRHPGDDGAAQALARERSAVPVPTPELATLIAALSLADCAVCPDGGAMHLAAALGKPVVALFGDSPPERWRPWAVPHRVLRPESRDLADLPVGAVLEAYAQLAREGGAQHERG